MAGFATPTDTPDSGNVWLEGILWGTQWDSGATGNQPTRIAYYIAGLEGNEVVDLDRNTVTALEPFAEERQSINRAMLAIERVCNLDFVRADSQADTDIIWAMTNNADAQGALGWANPPGTETDGADGAKSLIVSNQELYDPTSPDPDLLAVGGFDYITFIHELGHAVGFAHPHDRGGDSTVFPGVGEPFGDYGDFDMNQGVYTMMSYNDGWKVAPQGDSPDPRYGFEGTPMALDIAGLQFMYGASAYKTGNDSYALPDRDEVGTYYACLWDTGGTDEIVGAERKANLIDLRAATLELEAGGGGFISYANGVHGGLTIANGVVIENATGGANEDAIVGNEARNRLDGLGRNDNIRGYEGADTVIGGGGHDTLWGDTGNDKIFGDAGTDEMKGGAGRDKFTFADTSDSSAGDGRDIVVDFGGTGDKISVAQVDANEDAAGNQRFRLDEGGSFATGEIRQTEQGQNILLEFNTDADGGAEMSVLLRRVTSVLAAGDFDL